MPAELPTAAAGHELHPSPLPPVPIPQNPDIPKGRLSRIVNRLPKGQFLRYLCVGIWNTFFGYLSFAAFLFLFSHLLPQRFLYLAVVVASLVSTPLNITVAYLCYKFFVFRTSGNYLIEWLRCFAVYGVGMLPACLSFPPSPSSCKPSFTTTAPLSLRPWLTPSNSPAITITSSLSFTPPQTPKPPQATSPEGSPWASPPSPASSATADSPSNPPNPQPEIPQQELPKP